MQSIRETPEYPGRIKSLHEVSTLRELIEFALPYGIAKVYMTANRRWAFLEKNRRKKALAHLLNRIIRKFAFNIWDVRSSNGGFMEDFHTMPVISIIDILIEEYAKQTGMINESSTFSMATFKLCGEGCISARMKSDIDKLHALKILRENNLSCMSKRKQGKPALYTQAVKTLYELEESLIRHNRTKSN